MKQSKAAPAAIVGTERRSLRRSMTIAFVVVTALIAGDIGWRMHLQSLASAERARIEAEVQPVKAQAATLATQLKLDDLSYFIRPEALTAAEQVDAGKAGLARHRDLLAQRAQLFREILQHEHALLDSPGSGAPANPVAGGSQSSTMVENATLTALSRSDAASADAIQALFDWAQTRLPQLRQTHTAQTESQAQAELQALYGHIKQTEQDDVHAADDAQAAVVAEDNRLQARVREMMQRAESPVLDQARQWLSSRT
jgi:hypothetical protein